MDCGTRNFASVAVELDGKEMRIVDFDLRDIGNTVRDWYANFYELVRRRFGKPSAVMIERQLGTNQKAACASHVAYALARVFATSEVEFVSSVGKFTRFVRLGWARKEVTGRGDRKQRK